MTVETLIIALHLFQAVLLTTAVLIVLWLVFLSLPGLMGGAPFVGARPESLRAMMALAGLRPGEKLVDLGSGDGRLLIAAARAGCPAVGYEINLFLVWYSRLRIWRSGLRRLARVRWANFWKADLAEADVVTVFGFSNIMGGLGRKFSSELKPGSRIVSLRYQLPGWTVVKQEGEAYLYIK